MKRYSFKQLVVPGRRNRSFRPAPPSPSPFLRTYPGKHKLWILALCWALAGIQSGWAQVDDIHQSALGPLLEPASKITFLKFKPGVALAPQDLFQNYGAVFGLTNNAAMHLQKAGQDRIGFTHYRFQQMVNQIPVEGGEYLVHQKAGQLTSANGRIVPNLNAEAIPRFTAGTALAIALRYTNARRYKWQTDPKFYPIPTLVFTPLGQTLNQQAPPPPNQYRLSYKIDVYALAPLSRNYVYVDALTGEVFKTINRIRTCTGATAATLYNGDQAIATELTVMGNYRLYDDCRSDGVCGDVGGTVHTRSYISGEINNATTSWTGAGAGASVHWAVARTYDFFYCTYGRQSFDGANGVIYNYINNNTYGQDNAFWDGTALNFGDGGGGSTSGALVSLDVAGHELTHGVTETTANLVYANEPGALNESFSDIFGTAVEYYGQGGTGDYDIAEDMWIPDGKLRSMSDPNEKSQPDTYLGTFWYAGPLDNGGVHTNSGVQNFWFYLLSEGGMGTNDIGDNYNVSGIGRDNAQAIAFQALTFYMNSMDAYIDARYATIQAAEDLFGACSPQAYQVANAWYAVGVGGPVGDLWSQDRPDDTGDEPNSISPYMWGSADIWVRRQNDGLVNQSHQNPEYRDPVLGVPNYVYVRVRNRSCTAPGEGTVKLYWAKASTGLSWPSPWTGAVIGGLQMGDPIGTLPTGSVAANGETILEFAWYPPDPADYSGTFGADFAHFCLLSRIETSASAPYGMTFPETTDLNLNVKNNNNIVWKNITILDDEAGSGLAGYVVIGNYLEQERLRTKLVFTSPKDQNPFTEVGQVRVQLGEALLKKWLAGDRVGEGFQVDHQGQIYLTSPTAWIGNIILSPQELHGVKLHFDLKEKPQHDSIFSFDLVQYRLAEPKDQVVGGERFEINAHALWRQQQNKKLTKQKMATSTDLTRPAPLTLQVFPNPLVRSATIRYQLAEPEQVTLVVYNNRGQLVATLVQQQQPAGLHEIAFDAASLPAGLYFCRLQTATTDLTKKILLVK